MVTPFFLGAVVGGVASGRVPQGIATGDVVTSWVNPTSTLGGVLAVLTCAYLAAVFLCLDALRDGHPELAEGFRLRALGTAVVTGLVGLVGPSCCAPTRRSSPTASSASACPWWRCPCSRAWRSIVLLVLRRVRGGAGDGGARRRHDPHRLGRGPVPYVLPPDLTIDGRRGRGAPPWWRCWSTLVMGSCVLVPALVYLYRLFQRSERITP